MKLRLKLLIRSWPVMVLLILSFSVSSSEAQTIDYSVHANIIYHITKYINWPEDKKKGDFIIGVIGDSPLLDELKTSTQNKLVGNQKIVVQSFAYNQAQFNCNILFICEDESHSLKRIINTLLNQPVLIMTEDDGLALRGSCINFIIVDGRLKMEFNKNNMESRNLKIASELLELGKIITN